MANDLWKGLRIVKTIMLGAAILVVPVTASAQTLIERLPPGSYLSTQSLPGTECMCRGNGTFYHEGQRTCLRTATGRRLALCNKVLNVLNWEISDNPCPDV
ncbi:MAG: hypothetical protein ACRCUE_09930 [Bosea sp. (in: a-proteobacteria)]